MNRIITLSILFSLTLSISCKSQSLNIDEFMKKYKSLKIKFINDKKFRKSRNLVLKSIKTDDISSDTIVFIEDFTDVTANYSCSFYMSGKTINYETYHSYKNGRRKNRLEIRETSLSGISPIIIRAIKNNCFDDVLEKGKKQRFSPNSTVLITIAIKKKYDYTTKTFMINYFKE